MVQESSLEGTGRAGHISGRRNENEYQSYFEDQVDYFGTSTPTFQLIEPGGWKIGLPLD